MHESHLARQILDLVLQRAALENATHVSAVRGWVAENEALSPQSLQFHFNAWAQGTLAQNARLDLRLVRVSAVCNACSSTYSPEHHLTVCPACGGTDGRLLGPVGLGVEEIEVAGP